MAAPALPPIALLLFSAGSSGTILPEEDVLDLFAALPERFEV